MAAHYSADEKNGYSIWWSSDGKDYCVDYYGYKTFVFDDGEESLSNVYNSAVITEIGQKQRLRSAVDGKILFTTENAVNTEILIPYYDENKFFRDGYIFVYTKTESYNGVTYEIGFMNPQGEWIVPLSESNPILETINDEATVQYFSKSLMYCGEGMMSFGVNNEYYLYNIKENTVCRILNNGKPSNNDVKITLSEGISFKDGCSVESYGYGVGYYKLYTDGTMERINIDYHDDCHEREGYLRQFLSLRFQKLIECFLHTASNQFFNLPLDNFLVELYNVVGHDLSSPFECLYSNFILPETGKPCLLFCLFQFAQLIVPYHILTFQFIGCQFCFKWLFSRAAASSGISGAAAAS